MKYNKSSHDQDQEEMFYAGSLEVSKKTGVARFVFGGNTSEVTFIFEEELFDGSIVLGEALGLHQQEAGQNRQRLMALPNARMAWSVYAETEKDFIVYLYVNEYQIIQPMSSINLVCGREARCTYHAEPALYERQIFNTACALLQLVSLQLEVTRFLGTDFNI